MSFVLEYVGPALSIEVFEVLIKFVECVELEIAVPRLHPDGVRAPTAWSLPHGIQAGCTACNACGSRAMFAALCSFLTSIFDLSA